MVVVLLGGGDRACNRTVAWISGGDAGNGGKGECSTLLPAAPETLFPLFFSSLSSSSSAGETFL